MFQEILNTANLYAAGVKQVQDRRDQWLKKHKELRDHLKEVADYLNNNTAYKQGFYIDTMHAFSEDINGTCADMPSITFRSGTMPMLVTFRSNMGEKKEYMEDGFKITFNPTITGQVLVLLLPHHSVLNKQPAQYATLAIIDEPEKFTMDIADKIISKGIEAAFYTSFTGMAQQEEEQTEDEAQKQSNQYHPIGFKHYETTEKVN